MSTTVGKIIDAELSNSGSDIKKANTPQEWRARLEVDEQGGFFVSTPRNAGDIEDASELFKDFGLDPSQWQVVSVRKSRWQRYDGEWLEAARVSIKPADLINGHNDADYYELIKEINKWKPSKAQTTTGPLTAIYAVADTQYGKDAGGGTEEIIRRVLRGLDESVARHKELLKMGRKIGTVVLPQLGDCIEGTSSQGGRVIGRSDLGVTQQVRVGRRVLMAWIKAFSPLCDELIVPVVPGNHDEPHRIVMTDPIDSWQIEVVSAVQDACAESEELKHVVFRYPSSDHSTLAIDIDGVVLGLAHGHQSRDAAKWWQGQALGQTPVGSADILLTGHYHHFHAKQVGPRLWIQVPTMDGGSAWFRDRQGLESPTGVVSLVIGKDYDPRRDLCVLAGENRLP